MCAKAVAPEYPVLFFETSDHWERWLEEHGESAPGVWLVGAGPARSADVGRGGVVANVNVEFLPSSEVVRSASFMLLKAMLPLGTVTFTSKGTLKPGTSKQGIMRRASMGSSWVKA
jgi:hypothetical protein